LWPASESKSTLSEETSTASLPTACTASVWQRAPAACASSAISATGWITPVSLFTIWIETSATSGRISARKRSRSSRPFASTGTMVSGTPRVSR